MKEFQTAGVNDKNQTTPDKVSSGEQM